MYQTISQSINNNLKHSDGQMLILAGRQKKQKSANTITEQNNQRRQEMKHNCLTTEFHICRHVFFTLEAQTSL